MSRSKRARDVSRRRLRVRRIPSKPRDGACARPTGSRSRAPTRMSRWSPSPLASTPVPRAAVLAQPLERLELAAPPAYRTSIVPRASVSRAHFSVSSWRLRRTAHPPVPRAAVSRAHFSISRWPPFAANVHVLLSHGQRFARAHSASRWPPPRSYTSCPTGTSPRSPSTPRAVRLRRGNAPPTGRRPASAFPKSSSSSFAANAPVSLSRGPRTARAEIGGSGRRVRMLLVPRERLRAEGIQRLDNRSSPPRALSGVFLG